MHTPGASAKPSAWKRALAACALLPVFACAIVTGAALHLDLPATRRLVATLVTDVTGKTIAGKLRLDRIARLGPSAIVLEGLGIEDPDGREVLRANRIVVDGPGWLGFTKLLGNSPSLVVRRIALDEVDLDLALDSANTPGIARAFAERAALPGPDVAAKAPRFSLTLEQVDIENVSVHGALANDRVLSAKVKALRAAFVLEPRGVRLSLKNAGLHEDGLLGAPLDATVSGDARLPRNEDGQSAEPVELHGDVDAAIGSLGLKLRGGQRDGHLAVELSAPSIGKADLAPWLGETGVAPPAPIALTARVTGETTLLAVELRIALPAYAARQRLSASPPPGSLELRGHVEPASRSVALEFFAKDLDVAAIAPGFAESRMDGQGSVRIDGARHAVRGAFHLDESELSPEGGATLSLPAVSGTFVASEGVADVQVRINEVGSPTEALVRIGANRVLAFAAHSVLPMLGALPRWKTLEPSLTKVNGRGEVWLSGSLIDGSLDAATRGALRGLSLPSAKLRLGRGDFAARVRGRTAEPDSLTLVASARGDDLALNGTTLTKFALRATGSLTRPRVHAEAEDGEERTWSADAVVEAATRSLAHVTLGLARAGTVLQGRVGALALGSRNEVRLDGIALGGGEFGGTLEGDLRVVDGELDGQLTGTGIELATVSKLLALPAPLRGTVDVDVDVRRTKHAQRVGYAELNVHRAGALFIDDVDAELGIDFEGREVAPRAAVRWRTPDAIANCTGGPLAAELGGDLALDGALLAPATWAQSTGHVELESATVDLDCIAPMLSLLAPQGMPVGALGGDVSIAAVAERSTPDERFALTAVKVGTSGLVLGAKPNDEGVVEYRSDRLDAKLEAHAEPTTGKLTLEATLLDATRKNAAARLGTARIETTVAKDWLSTPPTTAALALKLATTSFQANLEIPSLDERAREALPIPFRDTLSAVGGTLGISAHAWGTPLAPEAAVRATLRGLTGKSAAGEAGLPTIDVDTLATYRGDTGRLSGTVKLPRAELPAQTVATFEAEVRRPKPKLFGPKQRLQLDANAHLDKLPLGAFETLAKRGVSGAVSGTAHFLDDGQTPKLSLALESAGLAFGDVAFDEARLAFGPTKNAAASEVTADARLRIRGGGELHVQGQSGLLWLGGRPSLDPEIPGSLELEASAFPLGSVQPFLPAFVTRMDGRLDGRALATFRRLNEDDVTLSGGLRLTDGVLQIPEYGQDLSKIEAKLSARRGLVSVREVRATTPSGQLQGSLDARLLGFHLIDFTGQLVVPEGDELPIALQGQPIGTLRGLVAIRGERRDAERMDVDITGANLRFRLPASPSLGRSRSAPIALEPHPDVVILQPLGPLVETSNRSSSVAVNVVLRNATVEGSALRLVLSTEADHPIRATGGTDVSGELRFDSGWLKLMGKTFEVDRGVVRLRSEDPSNPYVNMTAHWNAPDGTVVFVDYVGNIKPLTREKLRFRSNPPRSEDAILGLFVFGDTYDLSGTAASDAQRRANQALGGVIATEVNQLFADVLPGLSAGIGATTQGYTATTVAYQFSDRLSAQATVEQAPGTGPLGVLGASNGSGGQTTNPGVATGDARTKFGLDWRFADRWLVRGSLGVSGGAASGLDLLYQRRY